MNTELEWARDPIPYSPKLSKMKVAHTASKPLKHRRDPQDGLPVLSPRPVPDEGVLSGGRAILPLKSYININIDGTQQSLRQSSPVENGLGWAQQPAPYLVTL